MKQPSARVVATSPATSGDVVLNELQHSPSGKERRKPGPGGSSKKHSSSKHDVTAGSDKSMQEGGAGGGTGKGVAPVRRRRSIVKPKLTRDELERVGGGGANRSGKSSKKK